MALSLNLNQCFIFLCGVPSLHVSHEAAMRECKWAVCLPCRSREVLALQICLKSLSLGYLRGNRTITLVWPWSELLVLGSDCKLPQLGAHKPLSDDAVGGTECQGLVLVVEVP